MKKQFRLKDTMNLFYSFSIVIPLIVISIVAILFVRNYIIDQSRDFNQQVLNNLKISIESYFEEPSRDLGALKEMLSISENGKVDETVIAFYNSQRWYHHFLIIGADGSVEYTYPENDGIVGFDYSKENAFSQIKTGKTEAWSKTYIYNVEDLISINYAIPYGDKVLLGVIHLDQLQDIFNETVTEDEIIVGVTDSFGVYVMHTDYELVEQKVQDFNISSGLLNHKAITNKGKDYYVSSIKTDYQEWHVIIYEPVSILTDKIKEFLFVMVGLILVMIFISIILGYNFNRVIFKNLQVLLLKTRDVKDGRYGVNMETSNFQEFDDIAQSFVSMTYEIKTREDQILSQKYEIEAMNKELEHRVVDRTNELFSANQELEIALDNLKSTQDQLIESEKLASLGDLVSGLAHEINTPLGIILTVITYLQETTKKVNESYKTGMLKKSDFESYLNTHSESETIINDNITKAIELISSFKLISAEQRNIEKREVDVKDFLDNIIRSVDPKLKKSSVSIEMHIKEDVLIQTIPISLYQIIINLIMNAKIHAYSNQPGKIDIFINKLPKHLEIIVQDYGEGIPDEHIKKIFEPFFTTKRGSGGTGLGLNIVYNTVKQNLQGDIKCLSEIGTGTQFIIHLPYNI